MINKMGRETLRWKYVSTRLIHAFLFYSVQIEDFWIVVSEILMCPVSYSLSSVYKLLVESKRYKMSYVVALLVLE